MSSIGEWLIKNIGTEKQAGAPPVLAPASVRNAYESSKRTGAPPPNAPVTPNETALTQPPSGVIAYEQQSTPAVAETKPSAVFPEDVWKKSSEEIRQKRLEALNYIGQVAAVSKESDPIIKSMHDQLNAAYPEPFKHFGDAEPQVKQLSEKLIGDDLKRDAIARMIASQIEAIDKPVPKGVSPTEHAANLIDKLAGPFLNVTNGVMGTSNAVAEAEGTRLMGGMSSSYLNYRNLFKEGRSAFKSQVDDLQRYKSTLIDVMHSMQNVSNSNFNRLATVSSPEFAEKSLGGNVLQPFTGKIIAKYGAPSDVVSRISRDQSQQAPKGENSSNVIKRTYVNGRFQ